MTAVDKAALEALVDPLATVCAEKRFDYSWRVFRKGDGWRALVASGFPIIDGQRTGESPCFGVDAPTADEALARAVAFSLDFARNARAYSPPGVPPWMRL